MSAAILIVGSIFFAALAKFGANLLEKVERLEQNSPEDGSAVGPKEDNEESKKNIKADEEALAAIYPDTSLHNSNHNKMNSSLSRLSALALVTLLTG